MVLENCYNCEECEKSKDNYICNFKKVNMGKKPYYDKRIPAKDKKNLDQIVCQFKPKRAGRYKVFKQSKIAKNQYLIIVRDSLTIEYNVDVVLNKKSYFYLISGKIPNGDLKVIRIFTKGELICDTWKDFNSQILAIITNFTENLECPSL